MKNLRSFEELNEWSRMQTQANIQSLIKKELEDAQGKGEQITKKMIQDSVDIYQKDLDDQEWTEIVDELCDIFVNKK